MAGAGLGAAAPLVVVAAGSVDDGKSTLIGRLLYDAELLTDDQRAELEESDFAFARVTDGLLAEREQGITIDVAWRYIELAGRRITIADTPGHEQYTRNMVTGASYAQLALLLVDAERGITDQTRRHLAIAGLLGVPGLVVVVNKMDRVGFDEERYRAIASEVDRLAARFPFVLRESIPTCAPDGVNVHRRGIAWYHGPTVYEVLTTFVPPAARATGTRCIVQSALYAGGTERLFAGHLTDGAIASGSELVVLPGGRHVTVTRVLLRGEPAPGATAPAAVALALAEELDVARGSVLCDVERTPTVADRIEAVVMVLADGAVIEAGLAVEVLCATQRVPGRIVSVHDRLAMDSIERVEAHTLTTNDIGHATIALDRPLVVERAEEGVTLGHLVLADGGSGDTLAAAVVQAVASGDVLSRESSDVLPGERARRRGHRGRIVWLTGLPASGKSTLARALERALFDRGAAVVVLDGDNLRRGLSADLGFTPEDRHTNIRRAGHVAQLLHESGLIVICALVSPYRADRDHVRDLVGRADFVEVWLDAPIELVTARDPKGIYARALRGELVGVTGIDAPFEPPERADFRVECAAWRFDETAALASRIVSETGLLEGVR